MVVETAYQYYLFNLNEAFSENVYLYMQKKPTYFFKQTFISRRWFKPKCVGWFCFAYGCDILSDYDNNCQCYDGVMLL